MNIVVLEKIKLLAVLVVFMGCSACTQQHALSSSVVEAKAFYGSPLALPYFTEGGKQSKHFNYASTMDCDHLDYLNLPYHYRSDRPMSHAKVIRSDLYGDQYLYNKNLPLSPGDMLEISIVNGEGFEGTYVINADGRIQLPLLAPILAAGLSSQLLSEKIELALVREKLFRANSARVGLRVLQWAPVEISVAGAVFQPGRVLINQKLPEQVLEKRVAAFGDYAPSRYLSEALRAASGIRPDAKLDQIVLIRNGWQVQVDLTGILLGGTVRDIALVAGDQIIVPTTGCFQPELVKPSQITPKGFRVFMSNLIETAKSNANAAVGRFSSNLPYGSRLLQAAISANCIGGTSWTNASRKILLASNNPMSGQIDVIERSVEQLIRHADRAEMNPYLMPNDAIACYDSDVTNLRDIAKTLVDVISPFKLF